MSSHEAFVEAFDALPNGAYGATYAGNRYRLTKSVLVSGRSQKLEAEELGGSDYISFNLYRLANGEALLKPCEMPAEKVIEFVMNVDVD